MAAHGSPVWLTPVITAAAGLIGVFAGGYFATRNARAAIVQRTNELEIASIDRRLSDFVAPFEQLSLENLQLARELKRRHGGDRVPNPAGIAEVRLERTASDLAIARSLTPWSRTAAGSGP